MGSVLELETAYENWTGSDPLITNRIFLFHFDTKYLIFNIAWGLSHDCRRDMLVWSKSYIYENSIGWGSKSLPVKFSAKFEIWPRNLPRNHKIHVIAVLRNFTYFTAINTCLWQWPIDYKSYIHYLTWCYPRITFHRQFIRGACKIFGEQNLD